jgi:HlyD family secretion protein
MHAEEGDVVKAGTVLARLDTRTLALQADQAAAQIEVQEQTLQRVRSGPRVQEVEQARSRLAAAQADQSRTQQDLSRLQGISGKTQGRGVSKQDLDRAESAVQTASAHADEAREALRLLEAGSRVEDIGTAEAQVKASRAQLALLRHEIELGELKAPVDAVVRSRLLEPGDIATPQKPVFTLALTQPKWVRVYVAEPDLGKVRAGMTARVLTDSQPDALTGKVSFIASTAEFTPKSVETEQLRTSLVYEVRILVDDEADRLRLGQPVTVQLTPGGS